MSTTKTTQPRGGPRGLKHLAALATATMSLGVVATALPVVTTGHPASPRPVPPSVRELQLGSLPSQRVAHGATAPTKGIQPSPSARAAAAPQDVVTSVSQGAPLVAITWAAGNAPADHTTIEIRGRDAKGWGDWTTAEVNASLRDPAAVKAGVAQRVGTDPVWLGEGVSSVQVRYPAQGDAHLGQGRVELVDPGTSPADAPATLPAGSAVAMAQQPPVIWRYQWGADESMRRCAPDYSTTTNGGVLHHTVDSNNYTASQSKAIVRSIYAYHTQSLGWCDIGYNMLVDKYGQIFEGRWGGVDRPVIGAHAIGFNTDTFGVSLIGTYTSVKPTSAALNAIENVFAWRIGGFYRNAAGSTVLTSASSSSRYKAGTRVTLPFITGHRDTYYTECPGNALYPYLPQIRTAVAQRATYGTSPIYKRWAAMGGASSKWGPVNRRETPTTWGARTVFQKLQTVSATPKGVFVVGGGIDAVYLRMDGINKLGYPVQDEYAIPGGTRVDYSSGMTFTWNPQAGAHALHGGLRLYWLRTGGGTSPLGFATAEMKAVAGGWGQSFQKGSAWWIAATGAHRTANGIGWNYAHVGGPASALKFPTSEEYATATGTRQDFQGGHITWDRASGQIAVVYAS
ncbi:N-acetylmuramoyl-L-alanine amidase [Oryzihumus sp.]